MYERIKAWRAQLSGYFDEFEHVHDKLKERGEPDPLHVLFPIVYKRVVARSEAKPDRHLLMFLGQYFSTQRPELAEYFIGREQRESLEAMRDLLSKVGDE